MKVGIALSGGGARGFFHLGALKALEKLKVKIDVISGTSVGSLIGGCYALYADAFVAEEKLFEVFDRYSADIIALRNYSSSLALDQKNAFFENSFNFLKEFFLWNLHIIRPYLIEPKPFLKIFKDIFGEKSFKDCKIPFCATSVDLIKGELVLFEEGLIHKGVIASCALPGLFPPFRMGDKLLVDGGVLMPMPVMAIKEKNTFVIGVNLERPEQIKPQVKNAMDILFTSDKIRYKRLLQYNIDEADFLFYPGLEDFQWLDFDRIRELVKLGEEYALGLGDQLLKKIRGKKVKSFFYTKIPFLSRESRSEEKPGDASALPAGEQKDI